MILYVCDRCGAAARAERFYIEVRRSNGDQERLQTQQLADVSELLLCAKCIAQLKQFLRGADLEK